MKINLAKTAGFCFGVQKAVDKVYDLAENEKNIYTYGPIIHNNIVVDDLELRGVRVVNEVSELDSLEKGIVVIRSHGATKAVHEEIRDKGFEVIDATCPFVSRIHKIAEDESKKGKSIIVVGSPDHPEVQGIVGWASGPCYVVESPENAEKSDFDGDAEYTVVAQTTYNYNKFKEVVEIFDKKGYNIHVVNTICNATKERQTEADEIAQNVDAMFVVGGRGSSNTAKLYDICKNRCVNTYFIETVDDVPKSIPENVKKIGITAGASTPRKIIEEVQNNVRTNL